MDELRQEIYERLSTLQWLLQRFHVENVRRSGVSIDPTRGQGRVLALLKVQVDMTTRDLAYILGIRQQSLNDLLKKLEKAGLVERIPSEKDRRVLIVRLTEKGKAYQSEEQNLSELFAGFSEEDLEKFSEYLSRLITTLSNEYGDPFDEDVRKWAEDFRARINEGDIAKIMSKIRGGNSRFGVGPFGAVFGDRGGNARPDFRDAPPEGVPGAERFDPDYDGPMRGCGGRSFGPNGFAASAARFTDNARLDFRGGAPADMPGAERFDPDYDGPVPEGRPTPLFSRKETSDDDAEPNGKEG